MPVKYWTIGLVVIGTVIGAYGSLYLKYGSADLHFSFKKLITNFKLYIGVILYGLATIFFLVALKFEDLSILYPFCALAYVWIVILSLKYLKESMNFYKWFGIATIVLGTVLIGLGG